MMKFYNLSIKHVLSLYKIGGLTDKYHKLIIIVSTACLNTNSLRLNMVIDFTIY